MTEPVELDRTARDLIAAAREDAPPNELVAERLRRSVDRALQLPAPPSRSRSRTAPMLAALGAAALGGALYAGELTRGTAEPPAASQPGPSAAPVSTAPPRVPPAVTHAPAPPPNAVVPEALRPSGDPAPSAAGTARANDTPSGRPEPPRAARSQQLGAEIELLARVNAAVNAGDGRRALELLADYDRRFRPSILGEERAAASVLSLCAAGRKAEARAAAARFARSWPRSPLSGRIASSCAGAE
ncbi:MAG TPA: hypothetical protein VFZ53_01660 [Polyangiaceae bacterium]